MGRTVLSPATPGWCLRFLGGAVKGRIIALKPGNNVIGSGNDCEVMLPSSEVLPRHLVVNVGDLVVTLQRVETATATLNGADMEQRRRTVVVGDVVSVGQTSFQFERSYPAVAHEESPFDWPETMFAESEPVGAPAPPLEPPRVHWVGAVLLLAIALGMFAWVGLAGKGSSGKAEAFSAEAVKQAVSGFPEVEVVASQGGLVVRGFVESRPRKLALVETVRPFSARVTVSVQAADEIVEHVRRYLASPALAINYTGRGILVVSGASDDEQMRQRIRQLTEDLHPTVLVVDRVQYRPKEVSNALREGDTREQWATWQSQLPGRLVSITEDGKGGRYIQLSNGNRYYEGAVLRSGVEVKNIDADAGIELSSPPEGGGK